MNWAEKINQFNSNLNLKVNLPRGIAVMNPFRNPYTQTLSQAFYSKYYSDKNPRTLILGINPGRFGAGLTGIPFTDPLKLENLCDIQNTLPKKSELSADFIYLMIEKAGGIKQFYKQFYFSSVCPLGFTRGGKNLNYYDDIILQEKVRPFIVASIRKQIEFGVNTEACYCLGEGKNFAFLEKLNSEYGFFQNLVPLPHPRFIMQYKRKKLKSYLQLYKDKLTSSFK